MLAHTPRWQDISVDAATRYRGPDAWSEERRLRNGLWLVRYGYGFDPGVWALGWGENAQDAYRQGVAAMASQELTLTTAEVAKVLGISPTSVRDHARRGRLPYACKGNTNQPSRFAPEDVWAFILKLDRVYPLGEGPDGI